MSLDNLGQKVGDKLRRLRKIGLSMECFTADFCNFLPKDFKTWLLGGWLSTGHQTPGFQGFSWNFLIS